MDAKREGVMSGVRSVRRFPDSKGGGFFPARHGPSPSKWTCRHIHLAN